MKLRGWILLDPPFAASSAKTDNRNLGRFGQRREFIQLFSHPWMRFSVVDYHYALGGDPGRWKIGTDGTGQGADALPGPPADPADHRTPAAFDG